MFRNKCYYLGGFDTIEDAALARREAEKQFFENSLSDIGYEKSEK